jgi:glycosyltransferase involved in cell wall biosynthesis
VGTSAPKTIVPRVVHVGPDRTFSGGMAALLAAYERHPPRGWVVELMPSWAPTAPAWGLGQTVRASWAITRLPRRDVVLHVHLSYRGSFVREGALLAVARVRGIPTCVTIHGSRFAAFAARAPGLVALVLRLPRLIFCLTQEDLAIVRRLAPRARAVILPNGVDLGPAPPPASSSEPVVLFAGELSTRKGLDVLLTAWPLVRAAIPASELQLAGPPGDVAIPTGVSGLRLLGTLPLDAVRPALEAARVAVLPSRAEAMPIFALEALAAARPLVATAVGATASFPASCTRHVAVGDAKGLAEALVAFLRDPGAAAASGLAGRAFVEARYSIEAVGERLGTAYRDLLNSTPMPGSFNDRSGGRPSASKVAE